MPLYILVNILEGHGQSTTNQWLLEQRIPYWTGKAFKQLELYKNYQLSDHINPFYLEADFNGDSALDIAFTVEQRSTKKKGFIILHGYTNKYFILGAGTKFGNGSDNFNWMDIWMVHRDLEVNKLIFDNNNEIKGSQILKLKSPGIDVSKSESAGGMIFWNGSQYLWVQTSD